MTADRTRGLRWALVCGLGLAGAGCATPDATSRLLTTAGAAAVVVGASLASDSQCYPSPQGATGPAYCSPGLSKSGRKAATALAIAGVGAAAAGYALQPKGPDQLGPAPAPRAPTAPYRLIRKAQPAATPEATAEGVAPEVTAPATPAAESSTGTTTASGAAPPPRVEEPAEPAPKGAPR